MDWGGESRGRSLKGQLEVRTDRLEHECQASTRLYHGDWGASYVSWTGKNTKPMPNPKPLGGGPEAQIWTGKTRGR